MLRGRRALVTLSALLLTTAGSIILPTARALALTDSPDAPWGVRGKVYALVQSGNDLYIGGKFSRLKADDSSIVYQVNSLARLDATTGIGDGTFAPAVTEGGDQGTVKALALSPDGTTLYLGGKFDAVDGLPFKNLAAIKVATGQPIATFDPAMNQVNTILVAPLTGEVYVGGSFRRVDGKPHLNLAAFAPDGTLDPLWTPSADDTVRKLAFDPDGQSMFVAGHFTTIDGQPEQSVARLNLDGTLNAWAVPSGTIVGPMTAWDLTTNLAGTRLYVGFGEKANYVAAFALDDGPIGQKLWLHHTPGNTESVALSPDETYLFIGGHFGTAHRTTQCGGNLHGLARVNAVTGKLDCGWLPHLFPDLGNYTGSHSLLVVGSTLWDSGFFTSICSQDMTICVKQQSLARFEI